MPVIGRRVYALTAAAPRDRNEPRAGTPSVMQSSQSQMVTLVNGSFGLGGARIKDRQIPYWSGPMHNDPNHINTWDDGRGVYFDQRRNIH
jgi:hypothetical protein